MCVSEFLCAKHRIRMHIAHTQSHLHLKSWTIHGLNIRRINVDTDENL